jgi:hypothetical protein
MLRYPDWRVKRKRRPAPVAAKPNQTGEARLRKMALSGHRDNDAIDYPRVDPKNRTPD